MLSKTLDHKLPGATAHRPQPREPPSSWLPCDYWLSAGETCGPFGLQFAPRPRGLLPKGVWGSAQVPKAKCIAKGHLGLTRPSGHSCQAPSGQDPDPTPLIPMACLRIHQTTACPQALTSPAFHWEHPSLFVAWSPALPCRFLRDACLMPTRLLNKPHPRTLVFPSFPHPPRTVNAGPLPVCVWVPG